MDNIRQGDDKMYYRKRTQRFQLVEHTLYTKKKNNYKLIFIDKYLFGMPIKFNECYLKKKYIIQELCYVIRFLILNVI